MAAIVIKLENIFLDQFLLMIDRKKFGPVTQSSYPVNDHWPILISSALSHKNWQLFKK